MSGGFYGADVGELRQLAGRFRQSADDLERAGSTLNQQVMGTMQWRGADAEGFRGAWGGSHRPRVAGVVAGLRSAAEALGRNADAQERASAAGADASGPHRWSGGGGGGGGGRGTPPLFGGDGSDLFEWLRDVGIGGSWEAIQAVVRGITDTTLPGGGNAWDLVSTIGSLVETPVIDVVDDLRLIGDTVDGLQNGGLSFYQMSDVGAAVLQKWPPLSVPHLIGDVTSVWTEAARQAMKVDWSAQGFQSTSAWVADHPWEALESVGDSVIGYLPTVGKELTSMFGIKL